MNSTKTSKFPFKAKVAVLAVAAVGIGGVGTMALLTDTTTTDISVTSASLGLTVNESATGTYTVAIDTANMKPGDIRTAEVKVKNTSTIPAVITSTKGSLTQYTSTLQDDLKADFTSAEFAANQEKKLTLTVKLPESITTPPATQTLKLKFDSEQTKFVG